MALQRFQSTGRGLLLAGAALGACVYGYLAGAVMAPVYLALTWWCIRGRRSPRQAAWLCAGCVLASMPMLLWHVWHPERYGELMRAYAVVDAPPVSVAASDQVLEAVRSRLETWWHYFNPDFLFLSGDTSMTNSTRRAGSVPWAFAVLLPIGMVRCARGTRLDQVILAGFITGPLAVVATGTLNLHRYQALFVLPFAALVAAYGVDYLWQRRTRAGRVMAIVLLASIALQFFGFYRHYMGAYRHDTSEWFGGNVRGAFDHVITAREKGDRLLISRRVPYGDRLLEILCAGAQPRRRAAGSHRRPRLRCRADADWLVARPDEAWLAALDNGWRRASSPPPSQPGTVTFVVYRKSGADRKPGCRFDRQVRASMLLPGTTMDNRYEIIEALAPRAAWDTFTALVASGWATR